MWRLMFVINSNYQSYFYNECLFFRTWTTVNNFCCFLYKMFNHECKKRYGVSILKINILYFINILCLCCEKSHLLFLSPQSYKIVYHNKIKNMYNSRVSTLFRYYLWYAKSHVWRLCTQHSVKDICCSPHHNSIKECVVQKTILNVNFLSSLCSNCNMDKLDGVIKIVLLLIITSYTNINNKCYNNSINYSFLKLLLPCLKLLVKKLRLKRSYLIRVLYFVKVKVVFHWTINFIFCFCNIKHPYNNYLQQIILSVSL